MIQEACVQLRGDFSAGRAARVLCWVVVPGCCLARCWQGCPGPGVLLPEGAPWGCLMDGLSPRSSAPCSHPYGSLRDFPDREAVCWVTTGSPRVRSARCQEGDIQHVSGGLQWTALASSRDLSTHSGLKHNLGVVWLNHSALLQARAGQTV